MAPTTKHCHCKQFRCTSPWLDEAAHAHGSSVHFLSGATTTLGREGLRTIQQQQQSMLYSIPLVVICFNGGNALGKLGVLQVDYISGRSYLTTYIGKITVGNTTSKSSHHEDYDIALTFGRFGDAFLSMRLKKSVILADLISTFTM